jgi:hypothetical protein
MFVVLPFVPKRSPRSLPEWVHRWLFGHLWQLSQYDFPSKEEVSAEIPFHWSHSLFFSRSSTSDSSEGTVALLQLSPDNLVMP